MKSDVASFFPVFFKDVVRFLKIWHTLKVLQSTTPQKHKFIYHMVLNVRLFLFYLCFPRCAFLEFRGTTFASLSLEWKRAPKSQSFHRELLSACIQRNKIFIQSKARRIFTCLHALF